MLLHFAAGIEHSLMVEYLYAAYSLGGDQVPARHRDMVRQWRRMILSIAKEEMGHLLTVQNVLTLLGGPITWPREDALWESGYYPFKHALAPLTMTSLSCYVFVEAPAHAAQANEKYWGESPAVVKRILDAVKSEVQGAQPHQVDDLYKEIIALIKDPTRIPDSAFRSETYAAQASWDEWGKGYRPFTADPETAPAGRPIAAKRAPGPEDGSDSPEVLAHVILPQVASRTQAVAALELVAEQGESAHVLGVADEPSHFDRFATIYQQFAQVRSWSPTRQVPVNPTTQPPEAFGRAQIIGSTDRTYIESPHSRDWAHLFNLRYRMLLTYLTHMYRLPPPADPTQPHMRAGALHRVFSEMYNLRAIAELLVRLPLKDEEQSPNDPRRAGPPFELPYTMALPMADDDCWRLHRELLVTSDALSHRLLPDAPADGQHYLRALIDLDRQSVAWIDAVLPGPGSTPRSGR